MSLYYDLVYSSSISTKFISNNNIELNVSDTGKFVQGEATTVGPYSITIDINGIKKGNYWNVYMSQPHSEPDGNLTTIGTVYLSSIGTSIHMNIYVSYGNGLTSASTFDDTINIPNYIISQGPINYPISSTPSRLVPLAYPLTPPYDSQYQGTSILTPRPYGILLKLICTDIKTINSDTVLYLSAHVEYYTNPFV